MSTQRLQISDFAVQYSNASYDQIKKSGHDLVIVEAAPDQPAGSSDLSNDEVRNLVQNGIDVVGYVSVGQTDDARPYWDPSWTDDGTDTGKPTIEAPGWLAEKAESWDAAMVEFWDPEWQNIVIGQVIEMVKRGYSGIFLDNILSYYELADVRGEQGTKMSQYYAQEMMDLVIRISDIAKKYNPDVAIIANGGPYIIGDAGAFGTKRADDYLAAVDGIMAESFFGLHGGNRQEKTLDVYEKFWGANGIEVLALEYSTDPDAIDAFVEEAVARGFAVSVSPTQALDNLPEALTKRPTPPPAEEGDGDDQDDDDDGDDDEDDDDDGPMVLIGNDKDNTLTGGDFGDILIGRGGDDTLDGGDGDDAMFGGRGADHIFGGWGDDVIFGNRGNDKMLGGDGDDALFGGRGNDKIKGGKGADLLEGRKGDDRLSGGRDADELYGGKGADKLRGGADDDILAGGRDNDALFGGRGADELFGGRGDDRLSGGGGADYIEGNKGNDALYGGAGDDDLRGGAGNDRIGGGAGDDDMEGGSGADTFIFNFAGDDTIEDFEIGIDMIAFKGRAQDYDVTETDDGVRLTFENGSSLELEEIEMDQVDQIDFIV